MKKTVKTIILSFIAVILLSGVSCESLEDILPIPSMTATVDGESWTSIFRYSVLYEANGVIMITGTPEVSENVDKAIILSIFGKEAGTYVLSTTEPLSNQCAVVYKKTANAQNGSSDYYIAHTATITITKIDKEKKLLSGTFSATLMQSDTPEATNVVITNGKFENLNYQTEN